jgi:CheY-like chemotaxis protein
MPVKPLNILLIDDDSDEVHFFEAALSRLDIAYNLAHFLNCSDQLTQYLQQQKPDIIFLDINMPGKNGIQFLEELKADSRYQNIPIIMYSVSMRDEDLEKCYQLCAHHYLVKPYTEINFSESLRRLFATDWTQPQPKPSFEDFVINLSFA